MGMMAVEMDDEEEEEEEEDEVNCVYYLLSNGKVEPAKEVNRSCVLPTRAANYRENLLDLMPFTRCHFFAVMVM